VRSQAFEVKGGIKVVRPAVDFSPQERGASRGDFMPDGSRKICLPEFPQQLTLYLPNPAQKQKSLYLKKENQGGQDAL